MSSSSKTKTMLTTVLSSETKSKLFGYTQLPQNIVTHNSSESKPKNCFNPSNRYTRTHFEVSVPRIGEIHLTKMKGLHFKGFLLGVTIEAPRLVVTYLDFAPPAVPPTSIVWNQRLNAGFFRTGNVAKSKLAKSVGKFKIAWKTNLSGFNSL